MSTNIEIPAFEVATGSGEDRCITERLRISRQYQFFERRTLLGMDHIDDRNGCLIRAASQTGFRRHTSGNAPVNSVGEHASASYERHDKNPASELRNAFRIVGCLLRTILSAYFVHSCHCLAP